jgi:hypothetical protein
MSSDANLLLAVAKEFYEASRILAHGSCPISPTYFCLGRSVELGFKAILVCRGMNDDDLRSIGHNLEKLSEAVANKDCCTDLLNRYQWQQALPSFNRVYSGLELSYKPFSTSIPGGAPLWLGFAEDILTEATTTIRDSRAASA